MKLRRRSPLKSLAMTEINTQTSPVSVLSTTTGTVNSIEAVSQGSNCTAETPLRIRSNVFIEQNGVETTLQCDDDEMYATTPSKSRSLPFWRSLLDAELTPSPVGSTRRMSSVEEPPMISMTPRKVSFCGLGGGDCSNEASSDPTLENVQNKISCFLASPGSCLDSWQTWGYGMLSAQHLEETRHRQDLQNHMQRVFRNRAFNINARQQRLACLRRDLSPFENHNETKVALQKTRSFSYQSESPSLVKIVTPTKSSLWQCGLHCGNTFEDSPVYVRHHSEDSFYDSDPEDITRRRARSIRVVNDKENIDPQCRPYCPDASHEPTDAKQFVAEIMNEQMTLIMHEDTPTCKSFRPHGIYVWVERGQQLCNSTIILPPKLHYKPIQKDTTGMMRVAFQRTEVSCINLLDIYRILPMESIDRKVHPFLKLQCSFVIKTHDRTLLLEAKSSSDRDRIVKGLRLCVARLGSMLLTNNDGLSEEFFLSQEILEPDDDPDWFDDMHQW
jgi:hypothetical protein